MRAQRQVADPTRRPAVLAGILEARDGSRQPVVGADELGHEPRLRVQVDVGLGADLLDPAGVHDDDPVGDRERLGLVVGDVDRGLAGPPLEVEDRVLERVAQVPVERRQRLVEQQHARVGRQDAGQRDPLLLPAGQLGRQPRAVARQLDQREHLVDARRRIAVLPAPLTDSPNATLSATDRCGKSAGVWKTNPMFRFRGGRQVTSWSSKYDPAAARLDEPGDHPQRRRLAAAGRSEQRDELAVGDVQVEPVDGDGLAVVLRDRGEDGRSPSDQMYVPLK